LSTRLLSCKSVLFPSDIHFRTLATTGVTTINTTTTSTDIVAVEVARTSVSHKYHCLLFNQSYYIIVQRVERSVKRIASPCSTITTSLE
jgi:hypothetical protein